jgi:DtxR family Mn-dependent transcriptional regulator
MPAGGYAMFCDEASCGLSASLEDYLGTIFHLEQSNRVARAKDIAGRMNVRRASVTGALKTLAGRGLINYSPYSFITLTPAGRDTAKDIIRRHKILKDFFANILHLSLENAEANAHRMEHSIESAAIDKLVCFLEFVSICPRTDIKWLEAFARFCAHEPRTSDCRACLDACIQKMHDGQEGSRCAIDITDGVEERA